MTQDPILLNPRLRRWRASTFSVLLFGYIGYYLCRANISAAFPLLSQAFGYTNSQLGLIALSSEIVYSAGKFITGPWSDRMDGRRVFLIGMAGAIAANFVFAFMSSLAMFIFVWCICRFFLSMGWSAIIKTIGAWYPPEKNGTVMGAISLNFQFGGVAGTLFAGWLVSLGLSWPYLFICPACLVSVIWVWTFFGAKESPEAVDPTFVWNNRTSSILSIEKSTPVREIVRTLISHAYFRQVLLFSFLTTFLRSIFMFWTPKLLVDIGLGNANAIFQSALFPALGCIGTVFLGWYSDRFAKNGDRTPMMNVMLVGLVLSLAAVAYLIGNLGAVGLPTGMIVIFIGLSGFFLLGPYSMSAGCLSLDIAGSRGAGSAAGFVDGFGYIGGALATWVTGLIADRFGWRNVFIMLTACAVIALFSSITMGRIYRRSHASGRRG